MSAQAGHQSLYRKWRPERFSEVVGQDEAVRILRNSVQQNETGHAYLFAGPRGTGKTSVARILAKAVNCPNSSQGEPCNECQSCRNIVKETALDVVEIDGASNRGIDEIRELREEVNFVPAEIQKKVYIIDEVHMLTKEAFNALLKTIEEPPARVLFTFATTEPEKIPATIISRCQVLEFRHIQPQKIAGRLREVVEEEGISISDPAIDEIAGKADGSMRDGLVILEQMLSYQFNDEITTDDLQQVLGTAGEQLIRNYRDAVIEGDKSGALEVISTLANRGKDFQLFLEDVLGFLREEIIKGTTQDSPSSNSQLLTMADYILSLLDQLRASRDKRITLEIATLKLIDKFSPTPSQRELSQTSESEPTSPAQATEKKSKKTEQGGIDADQKTPVNNLKKDTPTTTGKSKKRWEQLMEEIEEERISVAAFLREAKPKFTDSGVFLEFDPQFSFHKESLESRENLSYLREMIASFFGEDYEVEIQYRDQSEADKNSTGLLEQKATLIKKRFNATILEEGRESS